MITKQQYEMMLPSYPNMARLEASGWAKMESRESETNMYYIVKQEIGWAAPLVHGCSTCLADLLRSAKQVMDEYTLTNKIAARLSKKEGKCEMTVKIGADEWQIDCGRYLKTEEGVTKEMESIAVTSVRRRLPTEAEFSEQSGSRQRIAANLKAILL